MKNSMLSIILALGLVAPCGAATLRFDFGAGELATPGNYNNISPAQLPILNAVDDTGAGTGIGLLTAGFNELGPNNSGTTTPTGAASIFDPEATRDNLFGHTSDFNAGGPRRPATLSFSGLDGSGATTYDFTFFGSRLGPSDNRETEYNVAGANNGVAFLNAVGNESAVATVTGITPTAAGDILVTIDEGPNNNQADKFFYLGALQVQSNVVPEPAALGLASLAGLIALAIRRDR